MVSALDKADAMLTLSSAL